jgi:hypothetical protein
MFRAFGLETSLVHVGRIVATITAGRPLFSSSDVQSLTGNDKSNERADSKKSAEVHSRR